jgi:hypothetical protein
MQWPEYHSDSLLIYIKPFVTTEAWRGSAVAGGSQWLNSFQILFRKFHLQIKVIVAQDNSN